MNSEIGLPQAAACVRAAQPADRDFVIALALRFGLTRADWREHDEVVSGTRRHLADAFDAPRAEDAILIAVDSNAERVGFAYLVTQIDFFTGEVHGHVSEVATVRDGSGAGRVLMDAAEAWSRSRGHRYLSLNVNETNESARRFYERRAYVPEYRHLVKVL